jgi:hypothetical protein
MIFVCCDLKQSKVVSLNKKDGITCVRVIYVVCPRIPPKARDVLSVWFPATLIIVSKRSYDSVPVDCSSKAFFCSINFKVSLGILLRSRRWLDTVKQASAAEQC